MQRDRETKHISFRKKTLDEEDSIYLILTIEFLKSDKRDLDKRKATNIKFTR